MTDVKVAACQYPIEFVGKWSVYRDKLDAFAQEADGADIMVFPEYGSMELVSLLSMDDRAALPRQLEAMQELLPGFLDAHADLARTHKAYVLAASFPARRPDGTYRNQAWLFGPDGCSDVQEKLQMTRFEAEIWGISPGEEVRVFDLAFGRVGIAICYDCEFPRLVRAQIEAQADIILVPSCTDALPGWNRVRLSAQARALENHVYTVQSPTVGSAPWSQAVDENTGAAGIYGPVDRGFPVDGVIQQGRLNESGWVTATLNMDALAQLRRDPQVFNRDDWKKQDGFIAKAPRPGKI